MNKTVINLLSVNKVKVELGYDNFISSENNDKESEEKT